jgi:hypothetical protein
VLLRWGVQRGTALIPKTSRPQRLAENLALCDFSLAAAQLAAALEGFDEGRRRNDPGVFCERAFGTLFSIDESPAGPTTGHRARRRSAGQRADHPLQVAGFG